MVEAYAQGPEQKTKQTVTPEMVQSLVRSYLERFNPLDAGVSRADAIGSMGTSNAVNAAVQKLNNAINLNPSYNEKYVPRYLSSGQIEVLNKINDVRVAVESELSKWGVTKSFNGADFQHTLATALGMELHEIHFTKGPEAAARKA